MNWEENPFLLLKQNISTEYIRKETHKCIHWYLAYQTFWFM